MFQHFYPLILRDDIYHLFVILHYKRQSFEQDNRAKIISMKSVITIPL